MLVVANKYANTPFQPKTALHVHAWSLAEHSTPLLLCALKACRWLGRMHGMAHTINLGNVATALHANADVQVAEALAAQDQHGLEGLLAQNLGLHQLQRSAYAWDERTTLSPFELLCFFCSSGNHAIALLALLQSRHGANASHACRMGWGYQHAWRPCCFKKTTKMCTKLFHCSPFSLIRPWPALQWATATADFCKQNTNEQMNYFMKAVAQLKPHNTCW